MDPTNQKINRENQTDIAINYYKGLLFSPTLLPEHKFCKSLMKLQRFKQVVIYKNSQKNAVNQRTFRNLQCHLTC